uniref:Uncharacterized protein n=1 Tax=Anguilla anguilla TaxID=7936 RepID=A0A0E9S3C5_ANGAN
MRLSNKIFCFSCFAWIQQVSM